jgi:hypothetical protein
VRWLLQTARRLVSSRHSRTAGDRVLIVKKGMSIEYYTFCEMLAKSNRVRVLFDRRQGERRKATESFWGPDRRRGLDRRVAAARSSDTNNVVLAHIRTKDVPLVTPERLAWEVGQSADGHPAR